MGMLHIYCGNGKGKTSAALGLALRALGNGLRVCVCAFFKGAPSGEFEALKRFEGARVLRSEGCEAFLWQMSDAERAVCLAGQRALLRAARDSEADVYVLDEVLDAPAADAFTVPELLEAVQALLARGEVVLTGREAAEELLERANYITQMRNLRHPYDHGAAARRGIEY